MKEKIKCPWCGRIVMFSKSGNLSPHRTPGNTHCVGVGQPRDTIEEFRWKKKKIQ